MILARLSKVGTIETFFNLQLKVTFLFSFSQDKTFVKLIF
jgi:hypothetical protein